MCLVLMVLSGIPLLSLCNAADLNGSTHDKPMTFADPPLGTGPYLIEDFEDTAVGQIPKGFTKTGAVGVVDDVSHTGGKSLRMAAAIKGARKITVKGDVLTALGGEHWGRLYFRVLLPAPTPVGTGIIHSSLVSGNALSPDFNDQIEVRLLGTLLNQQGTFKYLFNVQPKSRKEFGTFGKTPNQYTDQWTLAEWYVDYATQTYRSFINGTEVKELAVHKGAKQFAGAEIPQLFQDLSFGWTNYQPAAGTGFVAWIDDIALGKDRIGNRGIPQTAKSPHKHIGTPYSE
jgi:hypothetical protein